MIPETPQLSSDCFPNCQWNSDLGSGTSHFPAVDSPILSSFINHLPRRTVSISDVITHQRRKQNRSTQALLSDLQSPLIPATVAPSPPASPLHQSSARHSLHQRLDIQQRPQPLVLLLKSQVPGLPPICPEIGDR
jgi:hypothetical protein